MLQPLILKQTSNLKTWHINSRPPLDGGKGKLRNNNCTVVLHVDIVLGLPESPPMQCSVEHYSTNDMHPVDN